MSRREHTVYADALTSMFDQLLVKGRPSAWVSSLRIEFNDYRSQEDRASVGGWLVVACHAPRNYVIVAAAFNVIPVHEQDLMTLDWKPITSHDSCWRDGVEHTVTSAYEQVERIAVETFGRPAKDLSVYMKLDLLKEVPVATSLQSFLEQPERHGDLTISPQMCRR